MTIACLISLRAVYRFLKLPAQPTKYLREDEYTVPTLLKVLEHEGYKYERIDGGITGNMRQEAIDRFNGK